MQVKQFNEEFASLNKQCSELEVTLMNKEEILKHLQKDRDFFKDESSNLKEYNQVSAFSLLQEITLEINMDVKKIYIYTRLRTAKHSYFSHYRP